MRIFPSKSEHAPIEGSRVIADRGTRIVSAPLVRFVGTPRWIEVIDAAAQDKRRPSRAPWGRSPIIFPWWRAQHRFAACIELEAFRRPRLGPIQVGSVLLNFNRAFDIFDSRILGPRKQLAPT